MSKSLEITVTNKVGLHARPAALFVKEASRFSSKVLVENLSRGGAAVNARSILSVLSIGVNQDDRIRLSVEGADEDEALEALRVLIESNFGEGG